MYGAVMAYALALESGDMTLVRKVAVGDTGHFNSVQSDAATLRTAKALTKSAVARFGPKARDITRRGFPLMTVELEDRRLRFIEKVNGDRGTLADKSEAGDIGFPVRRVAGGWKFDLAAWTRSVTDEQADRETAWALDVTSQLVGVDIFLKQGRYKTIEEVEDLIALVRSGNDMRHFSPPAPKPATRVSADQAIAKMNRDKIDLAESFPDPGNARRIVFVCDNTDEIRLGESWPQGRITDVVARLKPGQQFGVVVFDQEIAVLNKPGLIEPTAASKDKLKQFFFDRPPRGDRSAVEAFAAALEYQPDLVYFFTSRGFADSKTNADGLKDAIAKSKSRPTVHSFQTVPWKESERTTSAALAGLAKSTGGVFVQVRDRAYRSREEPPVAAPPQPAPLARRIAFVSDLRGSLGADEDVVRFQLAKAIDGLRPPTEFQVIVPNIATEKPWVSSTRPVTADNNGKIAGHKLIEEVVPAGAPAPTQWGPALDIAFAGKPDLVYVNIGLNNPNLPVLADRIKALNASKTAKVNLLLLATKEQATAEKGFAEIQKQLSALAEENGGSYMWVTPQDLE